MSKIYDKTAASFKATTIDAKIIDAQKILVRPKNGSIDERLDILDITSSINKEENEDISKLVLGETPLIDLTTNKFSRTAETAGYSIQLDKYDWLAGGTKITEIRLPYTSADETHTERYCHIQCYNSAGEMISKFSSSNTQDRTSGESGVSIYSYDDCVLPEDYAYVRFILSTSLTLEATGTNSTNCSAYRINVCRNSANANISSRGYTKVYTIGGVQSYLGEVEVSYLGVRQNIRDFVTSSIDSEIDGELIENMRKNINEISGSYNEYDTNNFSTLVEGGSNMNTSSFRFGYGHVPNGIIKEVSTYGRDYTAGNDIFHSTTEGCYLLAKVYKTNGTLVTSYSSKNRVVLQFRPSSSENVLNTWLFDGIVTPKEDEVIKFIPSKDGINQEANYYIGILVDTSHTHANCQVGGDGNFANNPLETGASYLAMVKFKGYFKSDAIIDENILKSYEKEAIKSLYTVSDEKIVKFDNNINNEDLGQAGVKCFVLERPYISNGVFDEIRWESLGTLSSTCHLKMTIRDNNGHPVKSLMSENPESFGVEGLKSYRFKEFEITDEIGSLVFEPSTDGKTVNTSTSIRVRVIGNALKNDAGGSESSNNNYVIHCVFLGNDVSICENISELISNLNGKVSVVAQTVSDNIISTEEKFDDIENLIETLENKNYVYTDEENTFISNNTFNGTTTFKTGDYSITVDDSGLYSYFPLTSYVGLETNGNLHALPLNRTTLSGEEAYGISVTPPSADGKSGGLQLWGIQFTQGDEWSNNALKIVHNELALFGNHQAPCSLTFDNSNTVNFRVMPDDGSTANGGQGAIFDFQGWQWDNDNHTSKNANCPVQILKNNAGILTDRSLLNKAELDENYIIASEDNKHIVDTLNETIEETYAGISFNLNTPTNSGNYHIIIGNYDPIYVGDCEAGPHMAQKWAEAINNSDAPFEATYETNSGGADSIVHIRAIKPGEAFNLPIAMYYDGANGSVVQDVMCIKENATLTSTIENIKQIDFLADADENLANLYKNNTFEGSNTFNQTVFAKENIIVSNGVLAFEDLVDGTVMMIDETVTEHASASGYRYVKVIPSSFENGICYDLGVIDDNLDLYEIKFTGKGNLVQTCEIWFTTSDTLPTNHKWPKDIYWIDSANGSAPVLIANKNYRLVFRREPNKIIASIAYLY